MSGIKLTVSIKGAEFIKNALNRLKSGSNNISPILDRIGAYLVSETQLHFEDGAGPDGQKWDKKKDDTPAHLLQKGHLMQSITHFVNGDSVSIGTNVVYAAIHYFGGHTGRNHAANIPPRPYLGINEADESEIKDIITEYLNRIMR